MQPRKQFEQFQKLGDRIFRVPRVEPWRIPLALVRVPKFQSVSVAVLIWGFAIIIATGAVLLMLPISSRDHIWTSFPDALFTATSATCVTGLVVQETGTYWSQFGQAVILVLMQIGGFGFMASASLLLLAFGRSVGLREKLLIGESMGMQKLGGLVSLLIGIAFFTIFFEGIGAVIFYIRFSQEGGTPATAIWQSLFHSVSSFCNAGFDIFAAEETGGSLMRYNNDPLVVLTTAALVILGGISFLVAWDVFRKKTFGRLSLDSKLVIAMTIGLLALGTIVLLAMEYNNDSTLGSMPFSQKLMNAFFQSVTARTAGFNVVSVGVMTAYSLFFTIMLMFVGAASGSTAGGIKVSTFGVLIATVWSSLRGREHAEAFGRELRPQQIHRALAVAMLALGLVGIVTLVLTITEAHSIKDNGESFEFIDVLFETVSAFGTVGLSTGITGALTMAGKLIVIVTMFAGRLGPLTLALSLVQGQRVTGYRYPQDQVRIG